MFFRFPTSTFLPNVFRSRRLRGWRLAVHAIGARRRQDGEAPADEAATRGTEGIRSATSPLLGAGPNEPGARYDPCVTTPKPSAQIIYLSYRRSHCTIQVPPHLLVPPRIGNYSPPPAYRAPVTPLFPTQAKPER